ncbi:MAG: NAD(P)-dependent oxidoreductase [Bacteroidota bacterium]
MKVSIIDRFPSDFLQALSRRAVDFTYQPELQREEILKILPDTEILIMNSKIQLDEEAIAKSPKLKMVLRAGVGMDHIDVDVLRSKGVRVHNTKGGNADAVGEHTLAMLLSLRHNLQRADQEVRSFEWQREPNRGREIGGKTIGIIGYGHTGKSVAQKLSGFQPRVLAYDKYLENYGDVYAEEASLEQIFLEAEILTMHVPLTSETHQWVNQSFLSQFNNPIWFLNLARGPIVHIPDLIHMLDKGKVVAAGLDVLPNEKFATLTEEERSVYQQLFERENVILSPHIGGWTFESLANINGMLLDYVDDLLAHQGMSSAT